MNRADRETLNGPARDYHQLVRDLTALHARTRRGGPHTPQAIVAEGLLSGLVGLRLSMVGERWLMHVEDLEHLVAVVAAELEAGRTLAPGYAYNAINQRARGLGNLFEHLCHAFTGPTPPR